MASSPRNGDPRSSGRVYGKASGRSEAPVPVPAAADEPVAAGERITGRAAVGAGREAVSGARVASGRAIPASRGLRDGGGGFPPGGPGGPGAPVRRRARPRWGRIALVLGVVALLAVGCGAVYLYNLNSGLDRTDPFADVRGDRPAKTVDGSLNILMLGSDSRDPDSPKGDNNGPSRTDTIIIMHIPKSHDKAYMVSIPRDLHVYVPKSADGQFGDERAKINASFAWGGLPLVIQTVEGFTGLRMDHVVVIDFFGFKDVTDALGGVELNVERDIKSIHAPFRQFKKGTRHFNGDEALDYVRQRYQFPDSDFARMRHQQEFMKALLDKAVSTGTVSNPAKLNNFLKSATKAITVDKDFSLVDMALQFRSLRSENLAFITSPYTGTDTINGESVVVSDKTLAAAMYDAMRNDKMADWVAANPKPSTRPGG